MLWSVALRMAGLWCQLVAKGTGHTAGEIQLEPTPLHLEQITLHCRVAVAVLMLCHAVQCSAVM